MRRALAITLLLAFASPLVLSISAATADPDASLPACCRTHGAHHCAMMHAMLAADRGPAFTAPPCPHYPAAITLPALATAMLAAPRSISVSPIRTAAPPTPTPRPAHAFTPAANLNRGPPTFPA